MPFYVIDEHGQKVEAYSKQEVLSVLEQAIEKGSLAGITENSGFIEKIRCFVCGDTHKIAFVTQAKYNELAAGNLLEANAYYFITDDTTSQSLETSIANIINGNTTVGNAANADAADAVNGFSFARTQTKADGEEYISSKKLFPYESQTSIGGIGIKNLQWYAICHDSNSLLDRTFEIVTKNCGVFRVKTYGVAHKGVINAENTGSISSVAIAIMPFGAKVLPAKIGTFNCRVRQYNNTYYLDAILKVYGDDTASSDYTAVVTEVYEIIDNIKVSE